MPLPRLSTCWGLPCSSHTRAPSCRTVWLYTPRPVSQRGRRHGRYPCPLCSPCRCPRFHYIYRPEEGKRVMRSSRIVRCGTYCGTGAVVCPGRRHVRLIIISCAACVDRPGARRVCCRGVVGCISRTGCSALRIDAAQDIPDILLRDPCLDGCLRRLCGLCCAAFCASDYLFPPAARQRYRALPYDPIRRTGAAPGAKRHPRRSEGALLSGCFHAINYTICQTL
jgi:hypothetical protein